MTPNVTKICCLVLCLLASFGAEFRAFGQSALGRAQADLAEAVEQYKELQNQVAAEEAQLIEEVETLDDKVLRLSRELRTLEGQEALVTKEQQALANELERRQVEFDYFFKTFDQYRSQLVNRLHVAESQVYEPELEEMDLKVETAGDDLSAKVSANTPALMLGIDRLMKVAGGVSFEGKAAGPGNTLEEGTFALFGPLGFFSDKEGEVAGMTSFAAGDVNIPSILEMPLGDRAKVQKLVEQGEAVVPVDASLGKAFQIKEGKKSIREFLAAGGYVGYAILVFGLLGFALAFFKLIEILRFPVPSRGDVNEILDKLLDDRDEEAIAQAEGLKGLAGRVVEAGARYFRAKRRVLEDALFEKLSAVQPRLDRLLPFLAVIAAAAPMAGLLGTVLGIMKTFDMMAQFGTGDAKVTAGGIGEALVTTFLGLLVAIPIIMIHGVLKSLARSRLGQVEGLALALINGTTEIPKGKTDGERQAASAGGEQSKSGDNKHAEEDDEEDAVEDVVAEPARS